MNGRQSPLLATLQMGLALSLLVLASLLAFLVAPFARRRTAFWFMARRYARAVTRIWNVRHRMVGWENLPAPIRDGLQPAIFIANHTSNLDPIILACHLPCRPAFVAKQEVAFVPVLGWVTWLSGAIFVNRRDREKAIRSLRAAAQRVRGGLSVAAFPEGTRSRDGQLHPFKKGIFNLAFQAGVPVVPMGLTGTFEILPPGHWRFLPGRVCLRVGRPLDPGAFADPDALRLAAETAMAELLATSSNSTGQPRALMGSWP